MAFKLTPKSCGCRMCRYSKGVKRVKLFMKLDERAHRHRSDIALRTLYEDADILISHNGPRPG